ncbi:hypothetical protein F5B20DRAFT_382108 [Whalleya microplaca]|nr:hypothetical protein F5B20DRAFT_382108 [Whalleya microplaca]
MADKAEYSDGVGTPQTLGFRCFLVSFADRLISQEPVSLDRPQSRPPHWGRPGLDEKAVDRVRKNGVWRQKKHTSSSSNNQEQNIQPKSLHYRLPSGRNLPFPIQASIRRSRRRSSGIDVPDTGNEVTQGVDALYTESEGAHLSDQIERLDTSVSHNMNPLRHDVNSMADTLIRSDGETPRTKKVVQFQEHDDLFNKRPSQLVVLDIRMVMGFTILVSLFTGYLAGKLL